MRKTSPEHSSLPTQQVIAEMVGLSQETVSHILKGSVKKKYSEATRRRVIEVAASLNYRPNRAAQLMRREKSGTIGMIHILGYYEHLVDRYVSISKAIHQAGYRPLVSNIVSDYDEDLRTACDMMIDARVEGVVFDAPLPEYAIPQFKRLQDAGIPLVSFGSADRLPGVPHVTLDVKQGMQEMTRHLISLGYRRLTLIAPEVIIGRHGYREYTIAGRIAGFQEVVAEAGLTEAEVFTQSLTLEANPLYGYGELAARQILERNSIPEAILCINDYWTFGVLKVCMEKGIRVPVDLALTGFDNTQMGQFTCPPLTTTRQTPQAVGKKTIELLMAQIQGQEISPENQLTQFPYQLIVRESCGAPESLRTASLQPTNLLEKETAAINR